MGVKQWTLLLLPLFSLLSSCLACSVENWREMSMEERLYASDLVVLGVDLARFNRTIFDFPDRYVVEDSLFYVQCVLKTDRGFIFQNISIEQVKPRGSCSGTSGKVHVGDRLIVALKRTARRGFEWHEVNPKQTAAWPYTSENIQRVVRTCGLQNWIGPGLDGDSDLAWNNCPSLTIPRQCHTPPRRALEIAATFYTVATAWVWSMVIDLF